jgi:hypothetical protein
LRSKPRPFAKNRAPHVCWLDFAESMLIRFDGCTAIVAEAARGIGQAIARSLASDDARAFACDLLVDGVFPILVA